MLLFFQIENNQKENKEERKQKQNDDSSSTDNIIITSTSNSTINNNNYNTINIDNNTINTSENLPTYEESVATGTMYPYLNPYYAMQFNSFFSFNPYGLQIPSNQTPYILQMNQQ